MERRPLKARSAKKARFDQELAEVRPAIVKRSGGFCEAGLPKCTGRGQLIHHKGGRKRADANDPELLLYVCWACHDEIHDHPAQSYADGLLIHKHSFRMAQ